MTNKCVSSKITASFSSPVGAISESRPFNPNISRGMFKRNHRCQFKDFSRFLWQCRRLGRTEQKREMWVCQIPLKSNRLPYTLKNIVKPNFIPSESRKRQKRWVSLCFCLMWYVWRELLFLLLFRVLMESVLPNLRCHDEVFS